ncbi:MAG: Fe-S cluster assembly protein HesB [Patescibacteria group bacterium]|nr:Fe-S cluster assembly protein HesB [Patescibacteria group bacterium]
MKPSVNYPALSPVAIRRVRRRLFAWYRRHGQHDFIWRQHPTPYRVLVAEVMLQQTQVERVEPKYRRFLRRYPNIRSLARARTRELLSLWSGLGYNRRALHLRECAQQIVERHGGKIPSDPALLRQLPGVGPYTAAAINVFARNFDTVCVDVNVRRVLIHEFKLPHHLNHRALEAVALQAMPAGRAREWHSALMDYGRMVATSRKTGVKSRGKKPGAYVGSSRYYRGKIIGMLLQRKRLSFRAVADPLHLPEIEVKKITRRMERDGLVVIRGGYLRLPQ